mmetsp:Transcript_92790/g.248180  ORF Transcript_92790/g.248180 Transcript_92790/m.248180 type:complete len:354 (+) Transcript_92790:791-1852(+)
MTPVSLGTPLVVLMDRLSKCLFVALAETTHARTIHAAFASFSVMRKTEAPPGPFIALGPLAEALVVRKSALAALVVCHATLSDTLVLCVALPPERRSSLTWHRTGPRTLLHHTAPSQLGTTLATPVLRQSTPFARPLLATFARTISPHVALALHGDPTLSWHILKPKITWPAPETVLIQAFCSLRLLRHGRSCPAHPFARVTSRPFPSSFSHGVQAPASMRVLSLNTLAVCAGPLTLRRHSLGSSFVMVHTFASVISPFAWVRHITLVALAAFSGRYGKELLVQSIRIFHHEATAFANTLASHLHGVLRQRLVKVITLARDALHPPIPFAFIERILLRTPTSFCPLLREITGI